MAMVCAGTAACGDLPSGKDRKSQPAMVRQQMGDTEIAVVYNRPAARERTLFGGIVPYDSVWNPGADEATRLEISHDVRLNGERLSAGKYSIWVVPTRGEWTLIFSRAHDVPHVPYPEGKDALRIRVQPEAGPYKESLGFDFPVATADSAVLTLHWGSVVVPVRIKPTG
jgi:hypothetical protein